MAGDEPDARPNDQPGERPNEQPGAPPESQQSDRRWLGRAAQGGARSVEVVVGVYTTEYAIYGTVLVSALIAVGWHYDTDLEVFLFTLGTIAVFWLAHIYAGVVASHGSAEARGGVLWALILSAAWHSVGMVLAMLIPAVFLLLPAVGALDEYVGYYIALWAGVATLAALGFWNSVKRGRGWPRRSSTPPSPRRSASSSSG
ncbi:hypothetical protein [Microterricola viridarii]|uniref:Uncharacterized protein n=1 Tax=Microterricola viridarii TaxID=412690 RepID=A0A120I0T5_9MICO|nr:hypothetical protein [Microterricola viridarii]AMB58262.1 hypothetical protein AWU67_04675 [Microterricola viridarii]